jgi:hypothetical protein
VAEPFPRAFDPGSYRLGVSYLGELLQAAGFRDVWVETTELDARWQTAEGAACTLLGTPFGRWCPRCPSRISSAYAPAC